MQQQVIESLDNNLGELENVLGQLPLLGIIQADAVASRELPELLFGYACATSDRPDARVGVQHVDGRVALVFEHLVEGEYVVVAAVV